MLVGLNSCTLSSWPRLVQNEYVSRIEEDSLVKIEVAIQVAARVPEDQHLE